jgi:hypothetical protein
MLLFLKIYIYIYIYIEGTSLTKIEQDVQTLESLEGRHHSLIKLALRLVLWLELLGFGIFVCEVMDARTATQILQLTINY